MQNGAQQEQVQTFELKVACPATVRTWKLGNTVRDHNCERIYN